MNKKNKFNYAVNKEIIKNSKCKIIDLPIYKCNVKFIFGENSIKLEKDWGKDYKSFGGITRNYLKESGTVLVSFPSNNPKYDNVVHELYHVVDMVMNDIGHKKDPSGDEPSAYLMGYLIKEYKKLK